MDKTALYLSKGNGFKEPAFAKVGVWRLQSGCFWWEFSHTNFFGQIYDCMGSIHSYYLHRLGKKYGRWSMWPRYKVAIGPEMQKWTWTVLGCTMKNSQRIFIPGRLIIRHLSSVIGAFCRYHETFSQRITLFVTSKFMTSNNGMFVLLWRNSAILCTMGILPCQVFEFYQPMSVTRIMMHGLRKTAPTRQLWNTLTRLGIGSFVAPGENRHHSVHVCADRFEELDPQAEV